MFGRGQQKRLSKERRTFLNCICYTPQWWSLPHIKTPVHGKNRREWIIVLLKTLSFKRHTKIDSSRYDMQMCPDQCNTEAFNWIVLIWRRKKRESETEKRERRRNIENRDKTDFLECLHLQNIYRFPSLTLGDTSFCLFEGGSHCIFKGETISSQQ